MGEFTLGINTDGRVEGENTALKNKEVSSKTRIGAVANADIHRIDNRHSSRAIERGAGERRLPSGGQDSHMRSHLQDQLQMRLTRAGEKIGVDTQRRGQKGSVECYHDEDGAFTYDVSEAKVRLLLNANTGLAIFFLFFWSLLLSNSHHPTTTNKHTEKMVQGQANDLGAQAENLAHPGSRLLRWKAAPQMSLPRQQDLHAAVRSFVHCHSRTGFSGGFCR
jgi:hypothetical protein